MNFLLTYISRVPLNEVTWINVESWATYFPLSWETSQPSFYTNAFKGAIWMQRFVAFAKCIVGGFAIPVCGKHNISTTWFSIIMTRTPYTIDSIMSMFNWTIDRKNSLIKCRMGVNLRVVKLKSLIIHPHVTSLLTN
jgi:hypothetical protein